MRTKQTGRKMVQVPAKAHEAATRLAGQITYRTGQKTHIGEVFAQAVAAMERRLSEEAVSTESR